MAEPQKATKTPTLKTKAIPHSQYLCYFCGECAKIQSDNLCHNIPIQVSNFIKIHKRIAQLHHETMHATLWVSSPEAQPDQLITIATQITHINSSSIPS